MTLEISVGRRTHLSDGGGEHADDAFVRDCHHTLRVDLDDAVAHAHAAALRDATAQQTADDPVLHAEAQLELGVRTLDAHFDDWRARDDVELDGRLRARSLRGTDNPRTCCYILKYIIISSSKP